MSSITNGQISNRLMIGRIIKPNGCWEQDSAHISTDRRGRIRIDGVQHLVSRVSASLYLNFDLNSELQILHKCDNPSCFNPDHLFIGTNLDNRKDMNQKGRNGMSQWLNCPQGHDYDKENTYYYPSGKRGCRKCKYNENKKYREENREKVRAYMKEYGKTHPK